MNSIINLDVMNFRNRRKRKSLFDSKDSKGDRLEKDARTTLLESINLTEKGRQSSFDYKLSLLDTAFKLTDIQKECTDNKSEESPGVSETVKSLSISASALSFSGSLPLGNNHAIVPSKKGILSKRIIPTEPWYRKEIADYTSNFYTHNLYWNPGSSFLFYGCGSEIHVIDPYQCFQSHGKENYHSKGDEVYVGLLTKLTDNQLPLSIDGNRTGLKVAIGTDESAVYIYDVFAQHELGKYEVPRFEEPLLASGSTDIYINQQISSVRFNKNDLLAIGSPKGEVYLKDLRCSPLYGRHTTASVLSLSKNTQNRRTCGIAWNHHDDNILCTGSNDNIVCIWDVRFSSLPLHQITKHKAAIKAIDWCPLKKDVIALGTGLQEGDVCIYDVSASQPCLDSAIPGMASSLERNRTISNRLHHPSEIEIRRHARQKRELPAIGERKYRRDKINGALRQTTDSAPILRRLILKTQICGLKWNPHAMELITSHGFGQLENLMCVWNYEKNMKLMASNHFHSDRVLSIALSPDGQDVCSVSPDNALNFWRVFSNNIDIGEDHTPDKSIEVARDALNRVHASLEYSTTSNCPNDSTRGMSVNKYLRGIR